MSLTLFKSRLKNSWAHLLGKIVQPTLSSWFYHWIVRQNSYSKGWSPSNVYFEFGVAGGYTMREYLRAVELYCSTHNAKLDDFSIVGFDSFAGLPEKKGSADDTLDWQKGAMSHAPEEVLQKIKSFHFPENRVELVKGFFEESLTPALRERWVHTPPSIVTIDCDYYSSTMSVLLWLEPFIKSGTVFYFDDIWSFHGSPNHGEIKAIADINARGIIHLTPCPIFGLESHSFICSRTQWEYGE